MSLVVTRCMLLGCTFHYDDFGHPERAAARMYYTCTGPARTGMKPTSAYMGFVTGYGHSEVEAAYDWMRRTGMDKQFT